MNCVSVAHLSENPEEAEVFLARRAWVFRASFIPVWLLRSNGRGGQWNIPTMWSDYRIKLLHWDSSYHLTLPFLGTGQANKTDEFSGKFQMPPPLIFGKSCCNFFGKRPKKPYKKVQICNINFWIKKDPPSPLWMFSEKSSVFVAWPVPYLIETQFRYFLPSNFQAISNKANPLLAEQDQVINALSVLFSWSFFWSVLMWR